MNSPLCQWLAGVEETFWRMICGVFHFSFVHLPRSTYRALVEVVGPAAIRLARVSFALGLWLAVLLLPCWALGVVLEGIEHGLVGVVVAVLWLALALAGSWWGLSRFAKWRLRVGASETNPN